jgi:hypothetical protein
MHREGGNAAVKNNRNRVPVGADYPVRERVAFAIRITMIRGIVRCDSHRRDAHACGRGRHERDNPRARPRAVGVA